MTASLRVKNDKYYVVLTHTTDGKKNQTWVSTGLSVTGNEGKARQIMLDMLGEKPEQAAPPDMLFSDAVRRWLEDVRHRVDEVTYQGYEVQARAHILPYFDDLQIRLCDVDGETLQTYINVKAKFGRSDGHGGLSAVSLRQHKNVLNQTLKLAQRDGLIQTNPADLVVMPHAAQFTGTFYTESQMRDLLTAVKNERLYPIVYVTALYGLRRSEVLGLKWDSINFAMQTLTIRHTVARVTKVVEKNKTKNHIFYLKRNTLFCFTLQGICGYSAQRCMGVRGILLAGFCSVPGTTPLLHHFMGKRLGMTQIFYLSKLLHRPLDDRPCYYNCGNRTHTKTSAAKHTKHNHKHIQHHADVFHRPAVLLCQRKCHGFVGATPQICRRIEPRTK